MAIITKGLIILTMGLVGDTIVISDNWLMRFEYCVCRVNIVGNNLISSNAHDLKCTTRVHVGNTDRN
jgi:hypothetical protein